MYSKELAKKLNEVHELMENIVNKNKNDIDNSQLNVFEAMAMTLKELRDKVENQQALNRHLLSDFDKILSVSVRVFDGTRIDDLLWKINKELNKS